MCNKIKKCRGKSLILSVLNMTSSTKPGARFTKYLTIYHTTIFKFIVRSTYDSDLKRAEISFRNIISYTVVYEHYLRRYYDLARESYL